MMHWVCKLDSRYDFSEFLTQLVGLLFSVLLSMSKPWMCFQVNVTVSVDTRPEKTAIEAIAVNETKEVFVFEEIPMDLV
jgi:hypothetical protein